MTRGLIVFCTFSMGSPSHVANRFCRLSLRCHTFLHVFCGACCRPVFSFSCRLLRVAPSWSLIVFYTFSTGSPCPDVGRVLYVFSRHFSFSTGLAHVFIYVLYTFSVFRKLFKNEKGLPAENYNNKNMTRTFSRPTH